VVVWADATTLVLEEDMVTETVAEAGAGLPAESVSVTTRRPTVEVEIGSGWVTMLRANGDAPWTVTEPDPELNPEAEPVMVAVPGDTPTSYGTEESTEPLERVREPEGRLTTLLLEEESVTGMSELALAGKPAESRVSTKTVPWLLGFTSWVPGTGMMLRAVAKPLGVKVVTCVEAALRPLEDAEIEVTPGVALVVKFATAKAVPRVIVIWSVTTPTLS